MGPKFALGSLYDRINDQICPGISLWKPVKLQNDAYVATQNAHKEEWILDSEGTFTSKLCKLVVDPGLQLSLCGDMVNLGGHAKYFKDAKQTDEEAQVNLTYRETTVYKELTSNAFKEIDYHNYLTDDNMKEDFTHVVVGILYGGASTFIFKKKIFENEEKEKIESLLSAALEKISLIDNAKMDMDKTLKAITRDVRVEVYSDMKDTASNNTWHNAIDYCKQLPGKLRLDNNLHFAVPIKIYLLPKKALRSVHNTFTKEISGDITKISPKIIQDLNTAIRKASDLENKTRNLPILHKKTKRFRKHVESYKEIFQKYILANLLRDVRRGDRDNNSLYEAFHKHASSPFGNLQEWLDDIHSEVDILHGYKTNLSRHCKIVENKSFEQNLTEKMINFVLTLKVSSGEDIFFDKMKKYWFFVTKETGPKEFLDEKKWFRNQRFKNNMRRMVYSMVEAAEANNRNEKAGFFFEEIETKSTPECFISLFEEGRESSKSFVIPSKIENLCEGEITEKNISIKWCPPKEGEKNVSSYKVTVKRLTSENLKEGNNKNSNGERYEYKNEEKKTETIVCNENVQPNGQEKVIYKITDLDVNTKYKITVTPFFAKNICYSKSTEIIKSTLPCSPPSSFEVQVSKQRQVEVKWKKPEVLTKIEEIRNYWLEHKREGKDWETIILEANVFEYTFSNFDFSTTYKFRILASFGKNKHSHWSSEKSCTTGKLSVPVIIKVFNFNLLVFLLMI